jgi:hypothetical protein
MEINNLIKVGVLVSYDWEYLKQSLPIIYGHSDKIVLAVDINRNTWSGNKYNLPDEFFNFIKGFDLDNKISIYEDDFYDSSLTVMENDTRERRMLSDYMGEGGWHLQIDSDEYFIDYKGFINFLKKSYKKHKEAVDIYCPVISLFKKNSEGYFFVIQSEDAIIKFPIATNKPDYVNARVGRNKVITTDFYIIHDTWARTEDQLLLKLSNWSHANDFDVKSYFALWKAIDKNNYKYIKDFHPLENKFWYKLGYVESSSVPKLLLFLTNNPQKLMAEKDEMYILLKRIIKSFLRIFYKF